MEALLLAKPAAKQLLEEVKAIAVREAAIVIRVREARESAKSTTTTSNLGMSKIASVKRMRRTPLPRCKPSCPNWS